MLCSSYSGNTEETLAAYDAAGAAGAPRVVSASGGELAARARRDGVPVVPLPGGFQPRAAVGYAFVVALELAALAGVAPSARAEVEAAAELARGLAAEWGPDGDEDGEAKAMARRLDGTVPVIAGPGLAAAAAYRWKCQFNENAKLPAFAAELPEAGHNEIVGWAEASSFAPFAAIFLEDPGAGERAALRVALTAEIVADQAAAVEHVVPRGDDARRAAGLARPARRPRLALRRRAARRRPARDRADRPAQGRARRALAVGREIRTASGGAVQKKSAACAIVRSPIVPHSATNSSTPGADIRSRPRHQRTLAHLPPLTFRPVDRSPRLRSRIRSEPSSTPARAGGPVRTAARPRGRTDPPNRAAGAVTSDLRQRAVGAIYGAARPGLDGDQRGRPRRRQTVVSRTGSSPPVSSRRLIA